MKAIVLKVPEQHAVFALKEVIHFFTEYPNNKMGACTVGSLTFWLRQTKTQLIAETDEFRIANLGDNQ